MQYRAAVWYPAEKCAGSPAKYLGAFPAHAVPHAAPYGDDHPLVLISHGFGGDRYDQAYLAEHLAARGCVCLAPSYPDRIMPERWRYLFDRPRAFHMAYRQLMLSDMAATIDFSRVSLIAHSAGAYPTLIGAGATPRFTLEPVLEPALSYLEPFDPEPYSVEGVEAIILMAPALSNLFDAAGVSGIDAPVLIIAAELEKVRLLGTAQAYVTLLRNARLSVLEGAGHPEIRRTIRAETTKIESFNDFLDWITFGGPIIKSGDPVEQEKQVKYASLVANAIMLSNVADLTEALASMADDGLHVTPKLAAALSPYTRRHIRRFGKYELDMDDRPPPLSCRNNCPSTCPCELFTRTFNPLPFAGNALCFPHFRTQNRLPLLLEML